MLFSPSSSSIVIHRRFQVFESLFSHLDFVTLQSSDSIIPLLSFQKSKLRHSILDVVLLEPLLIPVYDD
ncbi:hypothetical protein CC2G_013682 [Coprinopsis cinerea AmutBmut pab1-1]|nr:hypothetical protein CC2G_013682 [Coprinopsis cinerea AmutBmut pab1-1]